MKYIFVCQCSGGPEKAKAAYEILFPNAQMPQIIKGKEAIAKFASQYQNDHLKAIAKLKGNFAYYLDISTTGKITEEYDLITGKRLA